MRKTLEDRRKASFREGVAGPTKDRTEASRELVKRLAAESKDAKDNNKTVVELQGRSNARTMVMAMNEKQLWHVSSSLGLHRKIWDRLAITPPRFLLRKAIEKRMQYLELDDGLLQRYRNNGVPALSEEEVAIACEERGINVIGRKVKDMRQDLSAWLDRSDKSESTGSTMLKMLFKR